MIMSFFFRITADAADAFVKSCLHGVVGGIFADGSKFPIAPVRLLLAVGAALTSAWKTISSPRIESRTTVELASLKALDVLEVFPQEQGENAWQFHFFDQ
ncbi:hypothetical protein [Cohaesibacter haloalkalitolerans]|uniref:hypothetical protein n=1 Tax=Cohaesibacter haloalkalitolerans TaxID=1162980 RepID=UPI0013C4E6E7|nr:hypothetical protein [Cohaesibacter haloalkalitolerans]